MDYAHWQIDHKMSYLSAYFKAGWLNVWDLGLAIHNLNDSQDPKHTLFCRENEFVAIYSLFQMYPFYPFRRGGRQTGTMSHLLTVSFFYRGASLNCSTSPNATHAAHPNHPNHIMSQKTKHLKYCRQNFMTSHPSSMRSFFPLNSIFFQNWTHSAVLLH